MAQPTALDIARTFGTAAKPKVNFAPANMHDAPLPNINLAPMQHATNKPANMHDAPVPSANVNLAPLTGTRQGVPTAGGQALASSSVGGTVPPPGATPVAARDLQSGPSFAPPITSFPTPTPTLPSLESGTGGDPEGSTTQKTGGTGVSKAPFTGNEAFPIDPELEAALQERSETGGLGTFSEFIETRFGPEAALIGAQFKEAEEQAAVDLARRGVLSSGEAAGTLIDLKTKQGMQKASLLGILNSEYNQLQQSNINQALNQLGVLQQGKVSFVQGIRQSNIAATATVQAASIQASASVSSARIGASAGVQVAKIGAQTALQRANMDFSLATRQLDDKMALQGIDPQRFNSDPIYRGDIIAHQAIVQNAKDMIYTAEAARLIEAI